MKVLGPTAYSTVTVHGLVTDHTLSEGGARDTILEWECGLIWNVV